MIKLYSENKDYKLYEGSMLDMLEVIEPNTIDSIVTDPPYELNFMNKGWDNSGIAFQPDTWKKCYEVLKPGGYLLAFGGSRTFHRIACAIEDAGFEIRDTIMWLYGSGFPKSMDISKQIDKKGGNDYSKQFAIDLKQARESRNLTMKYCDDKYCNSSTNWSWYEGRKDGCRVPDYQTYLEIVKDFPELEKYRELIKEAEREVIGQKEKLESYQYKNNNVYQTNGDKEKITLDITIPSTDLAKQWQGWGTALKPSFEPIIVARKPFKGSLVDNVIENGVGGINIDECRVGNEHFEQKEGNAKSQGKYGDKIWHEKSYDGRFPANTILTYDDTDFDEVCGGFPNTKSNGGKTTMSDFSKYKGSMMNTSNLKEESARKESNYIAPCDSGSASRYFYCAKASKKDRDEGLDGFEEKNMRLEQNRQIHSAGCEYIENGKMKQNPHLQSSCKRNIHPTVKPTELMQYLVRLVTPNGGTVLDPFNGSGSTGKAVMYENKEKNKNYKYIGIELTEEYLPIAKARIEYVCGEPVQEMLDLSDLD